ncbi:hypothetical protein EIN_429860 [Entamoeba invadens IP1]|uniref:Uncharacterized protein n=1 Tax=Entamoeba invadens IP1 TaxID=370355 RepID=A0A0A1UF44_ENTIV|nr:hypothetical protein EIN_429860 [Entamoeba invadens IP1]ELP95210.1 hypothetical protein EIN_429860 [Entamoeba invadens IP1]|eukprot:XP_004261981.1 hypothetical protein EIN_429860 [Entamoeba invadens IP1]
MSLLVIGFDTHAETVEKLQLKILTQILPGTGYSLFSLQTGEVLLPPTNDRKLLTTRFKTFNAPLDFYKCFETIKMYDVFESIYFVFVVSHPITIPSKELWTKETRPYAVLAYQTTVTYIKKDAPIVIPLNLGLQEDVLREDILNILEKQNFFGTAKKKAIPKMRSGGYEKRQEKVRCKIVKVTYVDKSYCLPIPIVEEQQLVSSVMCGTCEVCNESGKSVVNPQKGVFVLRFVEITPILFSLTYEDIVFVVLKKEIQVARFEANKRSYLRIKCQRGSAMVFDQIFWVADKEEKIVGFIEKINSVMDQKIPQRYLNLVIGLSRNNTELLSSFANEPCDGYVHQHC